MSRTCDCAVVCLATRHGDWREDCHRNRSDVDGHPSGRVPACRLHELAKVFFQTREAEGTEHTSVSGVHTAEEALRVLVRVNVSGGDFTRPLGATQRR